MLGDAVEGCIVGKFDGGKVGLLVGGLVVVFVSLDKESLVVTDLILYLLLFAITKLVL